MTTPAGEGVRPKPRDHTGTLVALKGVRRLADEQARHTSETEQLRHQLAAATTPTTTRRRRGGKEDDQ